MRHRAAAGLSESTDALIIVSSEERKNVVMAKSGEIFNVYSEEELSTRIKKHLGIVDEKRTGYRKERMKLLTAAAICLLLISGIWLSFTRGVDTIITLEVPVEYTGSRQDMILLDTSVKTVSVNLTVQRHF
jgi:hypothetical protein